MISAKIICDSFSDLNSKRLTTLELKYPRFIHSEFMTHRVFSRNAASSRAIPVSKMINDVLKNPAIPISWGSNKPGMQAGDELSDELKDQALSMWRNAAYNAVNIALNMQELNLHKQVINRILEPFQTMTTIVSATEWDNFFELRISHLAQPEIYELAKSINEVMKSSTPTKLNPNEWHLPYISIQERKEFTINDLKDISAARCARVSYLNHDGSNPDIFKDKLLAKNLRENKHASPFEHIAKPTVSYFHDSNFLGWFQYRKELGI